MKAQAEDPETIVYYEHETLPDVDLDMGVRQVADSKRVIPEAHVR